MKVILARTFGGLSRQYYLRQLFFGVVVAAIAFWMQTLGRPATPALMVWLTVNTLLYPYSRFVWEGIVSFVLGSNVFFLPAPIVLFFKLVMMFFCWMMAIIIAPVGLAWLYWHHSRSASVE